MINKTRTSSYNLRFDLPFQDRALLMHGYTGALDIVSLKLAELLCTGNGAHGETPLDHDVRQTLQDRGYLTEEQEPQERERVGKIFEVFERRLQPSVTLGLKLRGTAADLEAGVLGDPKKLFNALNSLRQFHVGGALALDLTGVTGGLDFFPALAERAKEWSYALVVTIKGRMVEQLLPFLDRDKIQYLRVLSVDPDFGQEAGAVVDFLQKALEKNLKCDWLISVDGRSEDEVRDAYERARQVKQMRRGRGGAVNVLFISERESGDLSKVLAEAREPVQTISTSEIPLYHHLCRFIESPGLVNLRPYFSIPDTNYVLDSSGEISALTRNGKGGQATPIGRLVDGKVEFHDGGPAGPASLAASGSVRRSESCDGCPYALICGVHCGVEQTDGSTACSSLFRQRVERVAPLIIFNKLQIV
jgi:hypothetical protein